MKQEAAREPAKAHRDDGPDTDHQRPPGAGEAAVEAPQRPPGVSEATVEALGSLSKALETIERARGHLYGFHQLTGTADFELDRAVRLLREAGHEEWADRVETELVGRNVIPGHWTFQIVEAYNRTYYEPFRDLEQEAVTRLAEGRDHLFEARLKERRRTRGHPDHTPCPPGPGPA